jgi:leucyl/phenylalanyl-tRNA--protein transferase
VSPIEPPATPWLLPDASRAEPGVELVGAGADLAPGTLLAAYRTGLFPMPIDDEGPMGWWSPDPRGVLVLDDLRVTRSLRVSCRRLTTTVDTAFDEVVRACGDPGRPGGWINDEVRAAYAELHRLGWAHSVETRTAEGDLVGGLYGVEIGGLFAGESMFSRATDASKVALVALVARLRAASDAVGADPSRRLLDVQWRTEHLASLGVTEVARPDYLRRLAAALPLRPAF